MTKTKVFKTGTTLFIALSILSLLSVSLLSFFNPGATMDLVGVSLNNTDALSSIRGVYGGTGLSICIALIYFLLKDPGKALVFLSLFWGLYAFSRWVTIWADGALGDFGNQWIAIESILCLCGLLLLWIKPVQNA